MNIVLVEDSMMIRMHLTALLSSLEGVQVVGQASTEDEAVALVSRLKPDLVLLDISLESGTGLNVLRKLRLAGDPPRVLVLTNHSEDRFRQLAIGLGARGYFDKSTELVQALAQIREWLGAGNWWRPPVPCPA